MPRRSLPARFALWAAVCALILKAAVPMLAAAAAQARGVSVAEVCSVYGVALPAVQDDHAHAHHDTDGHRHHGSHPGATHDDHCALTALATLASHEPPECTVASAPAASGRVASIKVIHCRDASAAWVARLKQGPPLPA